MMTDERTKPYTTQELATAAGVSDAYIRRLLLDGKLTGQKFGPWWMIPADEARLFIAQRRSRWEKF